MATPQPSHPAPADPDPRARYTGDMVRALNAANPHWWPRYETVDGRLLASPAPKVTHQTIVQALSLELGIHLRRFPVGQVLMSPADISFGRTDVVVQPDVFVMPADVARATRASGDWTDVTALLLACEVLGPRTRAADRGVKRQIYRRHGVPLYWIVDPDRRRVEVCTLADDALRIETRLLTWHPAGAAEPLAIDLARLFGGPGAAAGG